MSRTSKPNRCPGGSHQGIFIQARRARPASRRVLAFSLLAGALLTGCRRAPTEMPVVEFQATGPIAPTPVLEPTLGPISLWASPGLAPELLQLTAQLTEISGRPLHWGDDPTAADVLLVPEPERPLANWVFALAAPFPTLEDQLSLDELQQIWKGRADRPLYIAGEHAVALASVFGPASSNLRLVPVGDLLGLAWETPDALAIIPFDALEPRWKVLAVDGQSPIRNEFAADRYALTVPFGLSGDPALFDSVEEALAWPPTNRDPDKLTTVLMTGVTALVRGTAFKMDLYTPEYPALGIGEWLRGADLTHISNEVSFYENCPPPDPFASSLRFCSAVPHLALLEATEIDLIELTGNHLLDYGPQPFLESLDRYRDLGIQVFGGGADLTSALEPAIVEHNGNRLAFLGCNQAGPTVDWATEVSPGAMPCSDERLMARVRQLRDEGYLVVFTFQWPESISPRPLPNQEAGFRAAVDAGAVIVSGSQAHRPQAMEFYNGGFIHYGLGNLFFDQMHSLTHRQEFLDRHVFYEGRHLSTELLTALLEDYAQPQPMTEAERAVFLRELFAAGGW